MGRSSLLGLVSIIVFNVQSLFAMTLSLTSSPPVPGAYDIFNFSGADVDTNNVQASGGAPVANGGDNDNYTYIDASRAGQGQTFTTDHGNGAYVLTDIWLRHVGYSANDSDTYWMMAGGGQLVLRITRPSQVGTTAFVVSSETYTTTGAEGWSTSGANSPNGDAMWLHFHLSSPVTIAAGTTYGFDLVSENNNAFFELLGTSSNVLTGGSAYKGTSVASPDSTLNELVGDRVFLVGLAPVAASPLSARVFTENELELAWEETGLDGVLESSPLLGHTNTWSSDALPVPELIDGTNYVTVTTSDNARFYRVAVIPDFTLSASPSSVSLGRGSFSSSTISLTALGAFTDGVTLSASGLPAGVTASFDPNPTTSGSTLTLTADGSASVGPAPVTITGVSGSLTNTTSIDLNVTGSSSEFYTWPTYSPNIEYDYVDEFGIFNPPTTVMDDITGVAGTYTNGWWCFRYGSNMNSLVTSDAWIPMIERFNEDFAYITDVLRWPRDPRAQYGYFSSIYLFGSGLSTDTASNTDQGGWQSATTYLGRGWPMVLASYFPVYKFDPATTDDGSQGAMVHEGIHCILSGMPGCLNSGWAGEGGNTWLQGTMESQRSGEFGDIGWLSSGAAIAQFMPIECYSGWLQDGSFGGPSAEGVNVFSNDVQLCTWRNLLGGTQYGECYMHAMDTILGPKSVAWVYRNCNLSGRVLQDMAEHPQGVGPVQMRRFIQEYRARFAMCDYGRWSYAFSQRLKAVWNASIQEEYPPYWIDVPVWNATCYVATTNVAGTLYPEARTLPGWSGANQIPLTVSGTSASVTFNPLGENMSCQLVYRDTSGAVRYSFPVSSGVCSIPLTNVLNNVVIAVVCNTDYAYLGEYSRTNKFNYTLTLGAGVTGTANIYSQWFDYSPASYTLTASATGPGVISSPGVSTISSGGTKTYSITPNAGYSLLNVLVSGTPVGPVSTYTFRNVHGSTTIEAQFGIKTHSIYAKSSGTGTISPAGLEAVTAGANQSYTVTPNPGWEIYSLAVDGVDQGPLSSYTFYDVQADHNIAASFYGSNPLVPRPDDLLFAAVTETLPDSGTISEWVAYRPSGSSFLALQTPTVEIINGEKWVQNQRDDNDGFGVMSETSPIPCDGATIVVAVKPLRNSSDDPWNSIVECFYINLVLGIKNNTGELLVWRNGSGFPTGVFIPDGQRTVLSLVVQNTGTFKIFANGAQVYSSSSTSPFTQLAPGAESFMKSITVGRSSPIGWATFNGNIGDLYLYTSALSDSERIQLENLIRSNFGF